MPKLCECGCGEEVTNDRWKYKRGHKSTEAGSTSTEPAPDEAESEELSFELNLTLSES